MTEAQQITELQAYLEHVPAILNLLIAGAAMHYLMKLTKMRLDALKLAKGQNRRQADDQPNGFWASWAWLISQRLPEVIIAGIAIPDIPVLIQLIAG